ncbi:hypothetical protein V2G26_018932 [Clonostachys chloroleuca]
MGLTDDQPTPEAAVIGTRQLPRPNRQRASIACLHCRNRKIRCDVSRRGYPCANCRLDDTECEVVGRSSSRLSQYDADYMGVFFPDRDLSTRRNRNFNRRFSIMRGEYASFGAPRRYYGIFYVDYTHNTI